MYEQLNFLHAFLDINPLTGEQRYPYLRFDDRGTPFSSNPAVWQPDPRDPGIRVGMTRQLIESGLRRQAIAAQWEVDTAHIQQDIGDPNALDETTAHHVFDGGPPTYRHIKVTRLFFEHAANESCLRRLA